MDFTSSTPGSIADALVQQLRTTPDYRAVDTHGAARAAKAIADLL